MMFPCAIHVETVMNCPLLMSPRTPTSLKTFGWDSVFQRITSLQNCWRRMVRAAFQEAERISLTLTFPIFRKSSLFATLKVFTATRYPLYVPGLISANPPEATILFETLIIFIIMDFGNRPWIPASVVSTMRKACFFVVLRSYFARP